MSVNVPTNKTVTTTDAQLLPSSSSFNDVWATGFSDTSNAFANAYGALLRGVHEKMEAHMPLPMDISENDAGFQIDVSVPGTAAADVTVDLDTSTRVLSICTHKERPVGWVDDKITSEPGHHFHRRERVSSAQARSIRLPSHADLSSVKAQLESGVLHIFIARIGKAFAATVQRIPVA